MLNVCKKLETIAGVYSFGLRCWQVASGKWQMACSMKRVAEMYVLMWTDRAWLIMNGHYYNGRMIIFEWKTSKQQQNRAEAREKTKQEWGRKHQELKIVLT